MGPTAIADRGPDAAIATGDEPAPSAKLAREPLIDAPPARDGTAGMGSAMRPRAASWPGIIMEVTEDEILDDLDIANEVAAALREFNCALALDDFGAGYSSLARLRQLPFSELKIDRTFINAWEDRRVVEAVKKTGRRKVIIAALWSEMCLAMPAIHATGDGYDVYVASPWGSMAGPLQ